MCGCRSDVSCMLWSLLVGLAVIAGIITWLVVDSMNPHYYAAVASVSGLDPATDLGTRATLDPEFTLALRIAPRTLTSRACIEVGTALEVSYRGVRLAGAPAPHICARLGKAAEAMPVVAWGTAVRVPGFVLDSLAADMRAGAAAFDVTLTVPSVSAEDNSRQGKLVRCMTRRVGDHGALRDPCAVNDVDTAVVVAQTGN